MPSRTREKTLGREPKGFKVPVRIVSHPTALFVLPKMTESEIVSLPAPDSSVSFTPVIKKIAALALVVALILTGIKSIGSTVAFLSDIEVSPANIFMAGNLDFILESDSGTVPVCAEINKPKEISLSIKNHGNLFKYIASTTVATGDLCDYVNLEANLNGGDIKYTGPLKGFTYGPINFTDPNDWMFKLTIGSNLPENLYGQTCNFNISFLGSQTRNDLPFPQGFNDFEEVSDSVKATYCRNAETATIGYWKKHPEDYLPLLPQLLNNFLENDEINTAEEVEKVFDNYNLSMRNKLRGQLLAMKFNIAYFDIGDYVPEGENRNLNEIAKQADELLYQDPAPDDLVLEEMKNLLDMVNNLHQIRICFCDE